MKDTYIAYAKRTAVGSYLGSLSDYNASDLAAEVVKQMVEELNLPTEAIDEVILGNVLSAGQKQNMARQVAVKGLNNVNVPGYAINIVCGSGLQSVISASNQVMLGQSDLVIAGGAEIMSAAPHLLNGQRKGIKMGNTTVIDHMISEGLTDAFTDIHMGITAENVAEKFNLSKEEVNELAYNSQRKAIKAQDEGLFADEIVTVPVKNGRLSGEFSQDEFINRKTTIEVLNEKLRPVFKKDGIVTAGNSSGINDGAAIILVASKEALTKYNLTPIAKIKQSARVGIQPEIMGMGPLDAIKAVLTKENLDLMDVNSYEINEAFATQALAVNKELTKHYNANYEEFTNRVNAWGGSIAIGHPIGASGARVLTTLLNRIQKEDSKYGIASLCIGGGMGISLLIENVNGGK